MNFVGLSIAQQGNAFQMVYAACAAIRLVKLVFRQCANENDDITTAIVDKDARKSDFVV